MDEDDSTRLNDVDWEDGEAQDEEYSTFDGEVRFLVSSEEEKTELLRRRRVTTAAEKELYLKVHKAHFLCLLFRGSVLSSVCDDSTLQPAMVSILPTHFITSKTANFRALSGWFSNEFKINPQASPALCPSPSPSPYSAPSLTSLMTSSLTSAFQRRLGSREEVSLLAIVLLRGMGLRARLIVDLPVSPISPSLETSRKRAAVAPPVPHHPPIVPQISPQITPKITPKEPQNYKRRKGDVEYDLQLQMALEATSRESVQDVRNSTDNLWEGSSGRAGPSRGRPPRPPPVSGSETKKNKDKFEGPGRAWVREESSIFPSGRIWAEVVVPGGESGGNPGGSVGREGGSMWEAVDLVSGTSPGGALGLAGGRYVMAFSRGKIKDVTKKYAPIWSKVSPHRLPPEGQWWEGALSAMANKNMPAGTSSLDEGEERTSAELDADLAEDADMAMKGLTEPLPTNQQAYRQHPLYCLEKFLGKFQMLRPRGPVLGFVSGLPVFPRAAVKTLRTKPAWRAHGRDVREGEAPIKILEALGSSSKESGQVAASDGSKIELFGEWQTDPWSPPPAVDGKVPKNKHGNVEVLSSKSVQLPAGTVLLPLPLSEVAPIAQKLGVDFAPAVIGFERKKDKRTVPRFGGIVVCEEFADVITEAFLASEGERKREAEVARAELAYARWRMLIRAIKTRSQLEEQYGSQAVQEKISEPPKKIPQKEDKMEAKEGGNQKPLVTGKGHEHSFLEELETFDEENGIRRRKCSCGYTFEVEEL